MENTEWCSINPCPNTCLELTCSIFNYILDVPPLRSPVKVKSLSRVWLFATPWMVAYQAPWSMGFSRQEYWSGLPFPSPGDLPNPGTELGSPALQIDALPSEPPGKSRSSNSTSGSEGKAPVCRAGDPGLIPGLGRSPGEGNGHPLQYSCLENPMDREAWWATFMRSQRVRHDWGTFDQKN